MKFLITIGSNVLYTYELDGRQFKPQYIEGSDSFSFSTANITDDVNSYMEILANEKNLGTVAKLEFEILEGTDLNVSNAVINAFGDHIEKKISLSDALKKTINKLMRDKKLMIDTYGINYEGYSYNVQDGNLIQGNYDLLGYTIHSKDLVELLDA